MLVIALFAGKRKKKNDRIEQAMALPHYCVCLPKRRNDTQTSNSNATM